VASLAPGQRSVSVVVKVVEVRAVMESVGGRRVADCLVGDSSACCSVWVRDEQTEQLQPGSNVLLRNAAVEVVGGRLLLVVDRWALLQPGHHTAALDAPINLTNNISRVQWQLVTLEQ
jgi:replication factor A1